MQGEAWALARAVVNQAQRDREERERHQWRQLSIAVANGVAMAFKK